MRLEHRGEYPKDWPMIALRVKVEARWRCVRCRHPFHDMEKKSLACDPLCDRLRCRAVAIAERGGAHNFGVHHLDGNKANVEWWSLLALCNACHLTIQAKVIPERPYLWEHSDWFKPYVAGFYAFYHAGAKLTREEVLDDLDFFLALGQPWRAESRS